MRKGLLPPLNSLVAFEAAARYQSFTLAAIELNVTQGAVSRQIGILEKDIGAPLFERANRAIELTAVGTAYAERVRESLNALSSASAEIRGWHGPKQVTVATTSAMASLWLMPRIAEFKREAPDIDIHIIAIDQIKDLGRTEWDFALYYSRESLANFTARALFDEEVFPVCSPRYVDAVGDMCTPAHLGDATLLCLDEVNRDWLSWSRWFEQLGHAEIRPKNRIHTNSYSMLIQAALLGQGVALGWSQLVDRHLQDGALVRPMKEVLRTKSQFYLLEPPSHAVRRPGARVLRQWLVDAVPSHVGDLGLL